MVDPVEPHITSIKDLIALGRFGFSGAVLNVDADGQKSYETNTSGVSSEIQESLRIVLIGVENDFERSTLMSFGKLTKDVSSRLSDLEWIEGVGYPFHLKYSKVQEIDKNEGDNVQIRRRGDKVWKDLDSGWWLDTDKGILYIEAYTRVFGLYMLRVSYRYGIPEDDGSYEDVKLVILQKALAKLYGTDNGKAIFENNNWIIPPQSTLEAYERDYVTAIANRRNLVFAR